MQTVNKLLQCCHLPNKVDSIYIARIFPILLNGLEDIFLESCCGDITTVIRGKTAVMGNFFVKVPR